MQRGLTILLMICAGAAQAEHKFENRDLAKGQSLYAEHCAACHGSNLEGAPNWQIQNDDGTLPAPPHDQTGHTWHHDSQFLFDYIKLGGEASLAKGGVTGFQSAMPAFGDILTDDEIWNILAFIQSTWPERMQEIQAARSRGH